MSTKELFFQKHRLVDKNVCGMMYDIIFICGPYKTGTSLAADRLVGIGYHNPAFSNNQNEMGHGLSKKYFTHECLVTRSLNEEILQRNNLAGFKKVISSDALHFTSDKIIAYLSSLNQPTILKDGQFLYTLKVWVNACNQLKKKYKVIFTSRDRDELSMAWKKGYFTSSLLNYNDNTLQNMLKMLDVQKRQKDLDLKLKSNLIYKNGELYRTI